MRSRSRSVRQLLATRELPRAFGRYPATKFVLSANSSFKPECIRDSSIRMLAAQVRCWKKIDEVGKNRFRPASSDPSYILMPVQIVCNAKIFFSRDLAFRVTLAENLGGLRPPFVVRLEEGSPLRAGEPSRNGDSYDDEGDPLQSWSQTPERLSRTEKTGTAVRERER